MNMDECNRLIVQKQTQCPTQLQQLQTFGNFPIHTESENAVRFNKSHLIG